MKKILIVFVMILMTAFSEMNLYALDETPATSDFYPLSSESTSVGVETDSTLLTLKDDYQLSKTVYGDDTRDYRIDLTNFTLKLKIEDIQKYGRFTITFAGSRDNQPLVSGSEGISFVFRMVEDGTQLEIAILDAKTGALIDEMKGVQWAYLGNEESSWDQGIIGRLNGMYGSVEGSELTLKFQTDSASSGGTTFRPAMGSSLGVAIPIALFDSRSLDIKDLVMIISTGEGNTNYNFEDGTTSSEIPGSNMIFKVLSLEEPNTKKYRQSLERTTIINDVTAYATNAELLSNSDLLPEQYNSLIAKTFDLSGLRSRDQYVQQTRIDEAMAAITSISAIINGLNTLALDYQTKNQDLVDLNTMTEAELIAAENAKNAFEEGSVFLKYLSSTAQTDINNIISSINTTYILRAQLHFALNDFETAVDVFKDNIATAMPSDILTAIDVKNLIDTEHITLLDAVDESSFNQRYSDTLTILNTAIEQHLFEIEKQRISNYNDLASLLTDSSSQIEFEAAYSLRPTIDTTSFSLEEKNEIESLLSQANDLMKQAITSITNYFLTNYSTTVTPLTDRINLTNELLETAVNATYDADFVISLITISEGLGLDITETTDALYENDRLVAVASLFIDTTNYYHAIDSVTLSSQLELAYAFRALALSHLNDTIFNANELLEYEILFNSTDNEMNNTAKSFIEPALTLLEERIEEDLTINFKMNQAKAALAQIPNLIYLTSEEDYQLYSQRLSSAYDVLKSEDLYYFTADDSSSWYAQSTNQGVLLTGTNNLGIMNLQDPLSIDGLDIVFDYTKIGRIWSGEVDNEGVKTYPQNILVVNFMRDYGKIKDQSQGFSIYLNPNVLGELEVLIYGPDRDGQLIQLAQGKINGNNFTDPLNPYTIRIRISKEEAPLNAYQIWINSLKLNVYYRDFINYNEESPLHMSDYEVGSEVGENIFINDKAHVSFVLFGQDLTEEEREASITIKMLNEKTFAGYVAPLLPVEMFVDTEPTKMTYEKGELLDLSGLVVRILMSDGSYKTIDNALLTVGGFTSSSLGNKIVSLIYTEEGITLTKVIRVTIIDNTVIDPTPEMNLPLIIALSSVGILGLGVGGFFIMRKIRNRKNKIA